MACVRIPPTANKMYDGWRSERAASSQRQWEIGLFKPHGTHRTERNNYVGEKRPCDAHNHPPTHHRHLFSIIHSAICYVLYGKYPLVNMISMVALAAHSHTQPPPVAHACHVALRQGITYIYYQSSSITIDGRTYLSRSQTMPGSVECAWPQKNGDENNAMYF